MDDENDFLKTDPTTFLLNMNKRGYHVNLNKKLKDILGRSYIPEVANNYGDGVDASLGVKAKSLLGMKDGLANCILTASLWIDPETPIVLNTSILNDPYKYGYVPIPEEYILPGDLAIYLENHDGPTRHAMLVSGFLDNEAVNDILDLGKWTVPAGTPLVRYSNGHTRYKRDLPLNAVFNWFTGGDDYEDYSGTNPDGSEITLNYLGNPITINVKDLLSKSTKDHINFYRKYGSNENETLLPEIVVTNKGNYTPLGQSTIYINNGRVTKKSNLPWIPPEYHLLY